MARALTKAEIHAAQRLWGDSLEFATMLRATGCPKTARCSTSMSVRYYTRVRMVHRPHPGFDAPD
jgi:hypothetical protein